MTIKSAAVLWPAAGDGQAASPWGGIVWVSFDVPPDDSPPDPGAWPVSPSDPPMTSGDGPDTH